VRGIFLKDPSDWSLKIEEAGKYLRFTDQWGVGWQMPRQGGYYYDMYHHPLKGIRAEDVDKFPWPDPLDPARVKGLREEAMKIREDGFAVMMGNPFGAGVFEMVLWLQGFEDGFANLLTDKKLTHKLLDKMMDLKLKFWDLYLTEIGECVDVVIDGVVHGRGEGRSKKAAEQEAAHRTVTELGLLSDAPKEEKES